MDHSTGGTEVCLHHWQGPVLANHLIDFLMDSSRKYWDTLPGKEYNQVDVVKNLEPRIKRGLSCVSALQSSKGSLDKLIVKEISSYEESTSACLDWTLGTSHPAASALSTSHRCNPYWCEGA